MPEKTIVNETCRFLYKNFGYIQTFDTYTLPATTAQLPNIVAITTYFLVHLLWNERKAVFNAYF